MVVRLVGRAGSFAEMATAGISPLRPWDSSEKLGRLGGIKKLSRLARRVGHVTGQRVAQSADGKTATDDAGERCHRSCECLLQSSAYSIKSQLIAVRQFRVRVASVDRRWSTSDIRKQSSQRRSSFTA